ncbi:MAG: NTP transferase domain-containing protein [Candidatus Desulforudis sp.]|nr:NTP transferase domain-containing protein [Desulforudis sp.]
MSKQDGLVAVIIAGGVGTRFWPLSTAGMPKQFLRLFDDRSLLQGTYDRVAVLVPPERVLVLTNEGFVPLVHEQLPDIPEGNVIGEPMRRDTAGAVGLAAFLCRRRFGTPVLAVLPADHMIEPVDRFRQALMSAVAAARRDDALYTFGIPPTYPATGYGYLELGEQLADDGGIAHYRVLRFKEKPDVETARIYLEKGTFLWNSGMFVWNTNALLNEIETHLPGHFRHLRKLVAVDGLADWPAELRKVFASIPSISIDYGVMEKAVNVRAIAAPFSWSDVGGWPALEAFLAKDALNNACRGRVRVLGAESNIVFSEDTEETIALVGVQDLIVVRCGKRTLVATRDRIEDLKKLVESQALDEEPEAGDGINGGRKSLAKGGRE